MERNKQKHVEDSNESSRILEAGTSTSPFTEKSADLSEHQTKILSHNLLGQPQWPRWKSILTFFGLSLVMYMVCVSETIFNQILGPLKSQYGSSIFAQWMEAAFLLTCVILQPVWVKLAEKFGKPWPLFISTLIFMGFSIMVGAAKSIAVIVVGRAFQGIGGAGMMPLSLVILTDILTPGERGLYMGLFGAVILLGKWTGPVVGAAVWKFSSWRWAGYMQLPIGAVALIILYFTLHDLPTPPGRTSHKIREFDYLGTLFWLGGGIMILLGLSWGGNEHPWRSTIVVCLFVFGFIVTLIFGVIEGKFAKWPIIPLRILLRVRTLITLVSSFFLGMCLYTMIMFVPIYYMMIVGKDPYESSRYILWGLLGGCIGAVLGGILVDIRCRVFYRELAVVGTALSAIGYGVMYTWPRDVGESAKHNGFQVLVGLGFGLSMQQILLAGQTDIPANEISTVTTLIDYARTLGGMVGLVIGQVIVKEKMFSTVQSAFSFLGGLELSGKDLVELEAMMPMLKLMPSAMSDKVFAGIVHALQLLFAVNAAFAGVACILCLFLKNKPLHSIRPAEDNDEVIDGLRELYAKNGDSTMKQSDEQYQ